MTKLITDLGNWFISSGTAAVLFVFSWKYLKPVLEAKKLHAKTLQEKELLDVLEKLADNAVASLVGNQDLTGHDKFKEATKIVGGTLADKGFDVNQTTVEHAVQAAYEKSSLTPTIDPNKSKDDKQPKKSDPVLEAIKVAPNRVNKLTLDKTVEAKG